MARRVIDNYARRVKNRKKLDNLPVMKTNWTVKKNHYYFVSFFSEGMGKYHTHDVYVASRGTTSTTTRPFLSRLAFLSHIVLLTSNGMSLPSSVTGLISAISQPLEHQLGTQTVGFLARTAGGSYVTVLFCPCSRLLVTMDAFSCESFSKASIGMNSKSEEKDEFSTIWYMAVNTNVPIIKKP